MGKRSKNRSVWWDGALSLVSPTQPAWLLEIAERCPVHRTLGAEQQQQRHPLPQVVQQKIGQPLLRYTTSYDMSSNDIHARRYFRYRTRTADTP